MFYPFLGDDMNQVLHRCAEHFRIFKRVGPWHMLQVWAVMLQKLLFLRRATRSGRARLSRHHATVLLDKLPVVPHKAVAEVSRIGKL